MTSYTTVKAPHPDDAIVFIRRYLGLGERCGLKGFLLDLKRSGKGSEGWKLLYRVYFLAQERYPKEKLLALLGFVPRSFKTEKTPVPKRTRRQNSPIFAPKSGCPECGCFDPENRITSHCPSCGAPLVYPVK